ncbi:transposase family protein [Paucibacter sp. TC2R-5]|uniref:transposase family protein n=1 Tax=Paucibacter sp. TC2R-5 TaxID=2893555 RepID=UPI0021E40E4B|nr:transposase family protein [Paucibacter sp. TC2R-5]MCV2360404.1 transposase family protein [Paucibacter sp. TC2R-5]
MNFSLNVGLVLRHGQRTLKLVRHLTETEVVLEDVAQCRPVTVRTDQVLKRIWDKTYEVVLHVGSSASKNPKLEVPTQLAELGTKDQKVVERRLEYVRALQAAHVTRGQRNKVAALILKVAARRNEKPPSSSTVMSWARQFDRANCSTHALVSGNFRRRQKLRIHPLVEELISRVIIGVYLTKARHTMDFALTQLRSAAAKLVAQGALKEGEEKVSRATFARRVADVDLYHRIAAREGPNRARMVCRTAFGSELASYPLERVEIDHTPLNWVVICDRTGLPLGRPYLTVMLDSFSGYVLGFYVSFYGPGVTSLSGVLRCAISPKTDLMKGVKATHSWLASGVPDLVVVDNGLEFHSAAFKQMAWALQFSVQYCRVRTPWLKPRVERFFATLNHLTLVRGRVRKPKANEHRTDPDKDAALTFSDLIHGLTLFVTDVYPFQINERKLARPFDLFQEGIERRPPVEYPHSWEDFQMASALSAEVMVSQGGVQLKSLPYGGPELLDLRRRAGGNFRTQIKWDPDDLSRIYVQDPVEKNWLPSACRWSSYASGLSWNQHQMIRKHARAELGKKCAEEELMNARLQLHDHWINATRHRTRADATQRARMSGVTSARVMDPPKVDVTLDASRLVPKVHLPEVPLVVEEFETFEIN